MCHMTPLSTAEWAHIGGNINGMAFPSHMIGNLEAFASPDSAFLGHSTNSKVEVNRTW